jgi:hypothetical protein
MPLRSRPDFVDESLIASLRHNCQPLPLNSSWRRIAKNCWKLIFKRMVVEPTTETVASRCWVETRRICLELADGRCVSFPAAKYPLLASAPQNLLEHVQLRLHGLALRWEELDEDIWVDDAVCGRFPK